MSMIDKVYNSIKASNIRHEILSENIANASMSGFKSKDFAPNQTGFASTLAVNMTNNMHMSGTKKVQDIKIKSEKNSKHLKPNGNDVYLPEQMHKISQNQMNQQKLLKVYSYLEEMLKISVGR